MVLEASAPVRLVLLGGFELLEGRRRLHVPLSGQHLLAFLALHNRPLSRLFVAGNLWPDTSEARSCANLRSTLWRLHKPGCPLVESTGQHLRLDDSVAVDLHETMDLAQRVLTATSDIDPSDLAQLYRAHDLLLDWYFDWVMIERERFHQVRLHALEILCERLTAVGNFVLAIQAGLAAVAGEPLRESSQRALIGAYLGEGNRAQALKQYHAYCAILQDELQLKPSRRMEDLVRVSIQG